MLKRFIESFATPGLLIGLAAVMGGFYAADKALASLEQRELAAQARHRNEQGQALLRQGRADAAIEAFRNAHTLDRDNRSYQLGLAEAYIADKHPEQAEAVLGDVLAIDSNDGPANLLMARAMIIEQRNASADSYYHRAIYGSWPPGEDDRRVQARLELVRWLAKRGEQNELLSELLPLEQTTSSDSAIDREIPALYLQAGSLGRAEEAYRALMHAQPQEPAAYAGLGQVQLKKGDFRSAERSFAGALQRQPGEATVEHQLRIARKASELDPTPRRLTSEEKLARSNELLAMAADRLEACAGTRPGSPLPSLVSEARQLLVQKVKTANNEMAEHRLDLTEQLWQFHPEDCNEMRDQGELLAAVIKKLSSLNGNADQ